jgi:hypothetical protein
MAALTAAKSWRQAWDMAALTVQAGRRAWDMAAKVWRQAWDMAALTVQVLRLAAVVATMLVQVWHTVVATMLAQV